MTGPSTFPEVVLYRVTLADRSAPLGDCPGCGLTDAACMDAIERGKVKCCPDCQHREVTS